MKKPETAQNESVPGLPVLDASSALLTSCVHCGFCLEVCPTYQQTGDENNSPRGRLRLWRQEAQGRLDPDWWTVRYTQECVGCLACEPACPAKVPYGEILEEVRHQHVANGRHLPPLPLRLAAWLAARPRLFSLAALPVRMLRRAGVLPHRLVFAGKPAVLESTADYAARLMARHRPTGPRVALLTGCLMEAVFREINFATVRVLIRNNVQVVVPEQQGCCGAVHEHLGLSDVEQLRGASRQAFLAADVDAVVANSSGCGLSTMKSLGGALPVRDVLDFLGEVGVQPCSPRPETARVYVDLPCHLVHGQKLPGIPQSVLNATGYRWELAPQARDCCGSGGVYNLQQPENAQQILRNKSQFLNTAAGDPVILATSNHVCMMQWQSAGRTGLVQRPYQVRHVIQLLDTGDVT
ncbi:MAG: (Fe-S)-binding protein [Planctomycetaceae bacterium]